MLWLVEGPGGEGIDQTVEIREVICELGVQKAYCQARGPYSYNPVPSEILGMHT